MMISASVFVLVAVVLCVLAVGAVLAITHVAMSGSAAVERDGLYRGTRAPVWSLPDSTGQQRRSPPERPLQLILFTDHSLKWFPSVATGVRELMAESGAPDILILLRNRSEVAEPVLHRLGLAGVPVVTGSPSLYGRYNVRVTPFAILVDSAGLVRASSLVNYDWQIHKLHRLARIPLAGPGRPAERGLLRRRASAAGV